MISKWTLLVTIEPRLDEDSSATSGITSQCFYFESREDLVLAEEAIRNQYEQRYYFIKTVSFMALPGDAK